MAEPEKISKDVDAALLMAEMKRWQRLRVPFERVQQIQKGSFKIDYVSHAVVTDRLLEVDPTFTFEPVYNEDGVPILVTDYLQQGDSVGVWGVLTVLGVSKVDFCGGKDIESAYSRC